MIELEKTQIIRLSKLDNVVVARQTIKKGAIILEEAITSLEQIPLGYKICTREIKIGEPIFKYGAIIGHATRDISPGSLVHNHNIELDQHAIAHEFSAEYKPFESVPCDKSRTFLGYRRPNGRVGTRNYIGIIAASNCAATVVRRIANHFTEEYLEQFPNIDGVIPFVHEMGCGMELTGEPMDLLRRTLVGYAQNPNMGATLFVSLGCERNALDTLLNTQGIQQGELLRTIVIQESGGTKSAIDAGKEIIEEFLCQVNRFNREETQACHLMIGLQCGGSDGFSGLSANPALGVAADHVVRNGGTVILAETTETFGAEHILTRRAITPKVGKELVLTLDRWLKDTEGRDCQLNGVVSPGNSKGGISNILEKSLGSVKKAGSSPLNAVYQYGEKVRAQGLVFMDSPGYDPVSVTGEIAGGANLIAFTTGRGSCFGSFPSPTIKICSNTNVFQAMENDMDINCGAIIDGESTIEMMGNEIFETILRVASGEKTKSEAQGIGEDEFVPWNRGITA